ncbi:MAG TPA: GtrA family protein [Micromonosporaceae bacterium]|nr:GtrA family protein [Micromonosporaceae bacterium]
MPPTASREEPPTAGPGLVRSLYERFHHLIHELGKFGTVGAVAFVVDTVVYTLLLSRDMETLTAKTLATVVSATVAFLGNRFWTWRHRERSGLAREYSLYFFFNVVGLAIGLAVLGISHYGLGSLWPGIFQTTLGDLIAANIVGTAFGTLFRFWSYRRFVFLAPQVDDEESTQVEASTTDSSWKG